MNTTFLKNALKIIPQKNEIQIYASNITLPKRSESIGYEVGFYPYSKEINSDTFKILPYDEYAEDASGDVRSSYTLIINNFSNAFGTLLALAIISIFALFNPEDIFSIQSVVSVIGAYGIGKELWDDIENTLVHITKQFKLRFKPREIYYSKSEVSQVASMFTHAREKRYSSKILLADAFELNKQSNSKTLSLKLSKATVQTSESKQVLLAFITVKNTKRLQNTFMLVVKVTITQKFLFLRYQTSFFQLIDNGKIGVYAKETFLENSCMYRKAYSVGRFKYYGKNNLKEKFGLVEVQ